MLDFLPFYGFLECQKDVEKTRILRVESLGEVMVKWRTKSKLVHILYVFTILRFYYDASLALPFIDIFIDECKSGFVKLVNFITRIICNLYTVLV